MKASDAKTQKGHPADEEGAEPQLWFPAYVATYLERDVRNVLRVVDLQDFNRFLRACALRTAQVLNYLDLARDTGVAPNTARKWLGLLQSSAVVALVEPYFGNRSKRLIKSPKLAFTDTGLAVYLAGFRSAAELFRSSVGGAFWETHVIGQVLREAAGRGVRLTFGYWRTAGGPEVDLVIEKSAGHLAAIECKCKEQPDAGDAAGLRALHAAEGRRVEDRIIVCRTRAPYRLGDGTWVLGVSDALARLGFGGEK